jgi:hypothetical protein
MTIKRVDDDGKPRVSKYLPRLNWNKDPIQNILIPPLILMTMWG